MAKYKNIPFFNGLNALRFIAAFLVVMHHSEGIRAKNGLYNLGWLGLFQNGANAVTFFFVLSGFLITYLLLKEDDKNGTINVKRFYIKRVLRIWPLYFLLVAIGVLVLPYVFGILKINYQMPYTFAQVWYYFVFFMPGLVTFFYGHHFLELLWSIGVEEIFYLIWAPIFKFLKKWLLLVLLSIIAIKIVLMSIGLFYGTNRLFNYLVDTYRFEAMAIGGLGAYFIFNRQRELSTLFLYKKPMQLLVYLALATYLIFDANIHNAIWRAVFQMPVFSSFLVDFLFLYLIIGVSLIDNSMIKLRSKSLSYLGEISYGIYMYHILVVFAVIQFLKKYLLVLNPVASTLVFYATVAVVVILIASVSKFTFENYFLKLKTKKERRLATAKGLA